MTGEHITEWKAMCYSAKNQKVASLSKGDIIFYKDYMGDHNAMHEAEQYLRGRCGKYGESLSNLFLKNLQEIVDARQRGAWRLVHATSAQRAEAFVLTMEEK